MKINELVNKAHMNAKVHGFWEDFDNSNNAIAARLMLITSEVSEALEGLRHNDVDNFKEELADIIIRTCDLAGGLKVDLESEVKKKMDKNKNRPYKHGKEF